MINCSVAFNVNAHTRHGLCVRRQQRRQQGQQQEEGATTTKRLQEQQQQNQKWQRHWPMWRMSNSTLTPQRRAWFCLQPHTHTYIDPICHSHTHTLTHTLIHLSFASSVCFMFCVIVASSKNTKIFISNESCVQLGTAETGKQNAFSGHAPKTPKRRYPIKIEGYVKNKCK